MPKVKEHSQRVSNFNGGGTTWFQLGINYESQGGANANDTWWTVGEAAGGYWSNLYIRITVNSGASVAGSIKIFINGSAVNNAITIGTSDLGEKEDLLSVDAVAQGDQIKYVAIGTTGGSTTLSQYGASWTPNADCSASYGSFNHVGGTTDNQRKFFHFVSSTTSTSETADMQTKSRIAGQWLHLNLGVIINTRTGTPACTFSRRLNGADGSGSAIGVNTGVFGQLQELTGGDAIIAGDLLGKSTLNNNTGTNTGACAGLMHTNIVTKDNSMMDINDGPNAVTSWGTSVTGYNSLAGSDVATISTESQAQVARGVACYTSLYGVYLVTNSLTGTPAITWRVRKGGADANGFISINGGDAAGLKEDLSSVDGWLPTDEANWKTVTSATGTTSTADPVYCKRTIFSRAGLPQAGVGAR